jgi:hypothetical protein
VHDCLGRHAYGPRAFQLIHDDDPWDIVTAFEALAEELLGGLLIPPTLDQNVEDMAVLDRRLARDNDAHPGWTERPHPPGGRSKILSGISTAMTCSTCSLTWLAADLGIVKFMGKRYNPFHGVGL